MRPKEPGAWAPGPRGWYHHVTSLRRPCRGDQSSPNMPNNTDLQHQAMSDASTTRPHRTRQRSRIACQPCRERKRKCDGGDPCELCRNYGYDCSYRTFPRKRRREGGSMTSQQYPTSSHETTVAFSDQDPSPNVASTPFVQSLVSQPLGHNLMASL